MDEDSHERELFLKQQFQSNEDQIRILDEMNLKLHEMKKIAEYALEYELTPHEINKLNEQLNVLKNEVNALGNQLHTVLH